ncbi:MAG: PilZ domain-containing protein [Lachnospiraceae bacterium]|nr:PilZ domain-containing protein [Lachnospiraceae bacterium]
MEEKRHSQRSELTSKLMIKRLDSQDAGEEVTIDITDVSKGGVGFTCNKALEIGAVYESFLEIWTKEVLHAFLEIVRIEKKGDEYFYGSSFVGLPEMETQRIATYQTVTNMNQK